jgi:transcriptional regulator with XRE-family HTH domain
VPTESQREAFRKALRRAREEHGLSKRGLALKIGVTQSAVWQWEEGRVSPRPELLAVLERALDLAPGALALLLGYLPPEGVRKAPVSVTEAIEADPRLGSKERKLLVAMYRELVRQRKNGDRTT